MNSEAFGRTLMRLSTSGFRASTLILAVSGYGSLHLQPHLTSRMKRVALRHTLGRWATDDLRSFVDACPMLSVIDGNDDLLRQWNSRLTVQARGDVYSALFRNGKGLARFCGSVIDSCLNCGMWSIFKRCSNESCKIKRAHLCSECWGVLHSSSC